MKLIKKLIAIVIIAVQFLLLANNVNAANIGETKNLERAEKGYYCVQKWDGSKWIYLTYNRTYYTDTNGQKYIAYCLSPGLPGVGYVSGEKETYQVKIKEVLNNDTIWRIMKNGYPYKSVEELGVETEDDAYFATMQAINCVSRGYTLEEAKTLYIPGQFAINGENFNDIQRRGTKTLNAMYNLIDIGLNGNEKRGQLLNISIKSVTDFKKENNNFYSQTFSIQSSSEISEYNVNKIENLPDGSYVADTNGNKKQNFKSGENFKIMIPTNKIFTDIKGKISISAKQKNYPIYYGSSMLEGYQDYALCNSSYSEVYATSDVYVQTNKSKVIVTKVDKDTQEPIKGVKFQITGSNGVTNTFSTNENGQVVLANQIPGIVVIKEIEVAGNYVLNENEVKVDLEFGEIKEVKIENEVKRGNLKIVKFDKDDKNIKLENVKFQLKNEDGEVVKEGITNENGELIFDNLVIGKYKLVEVETVGDYKLNKQEIEVEVKYNETLEIEVENELKKGSIKVIKVDEDYKEIKLEGVKFRVLDEKDNMVKEGITDENGELIFDDIVVGSYKMVEIETKEEYELLDKEIVVEVKEDEIKEVIVGNKKIEIPEEPAPVPEPELEPEPELTPEPTPIPEELQFPELPKTGANQQNNYQTIINVLIISIYSICLLIKKFN